MKENIFFINYFYIWPVDGGGKKHLSTNLLYLFRNFKNITVLQGLGTNNDIPDELKNNVKLCKICNSARRISKILSFILFYIWALKIMIANHKRKNIIITIGWNLTFIGRIAKLINNKWINFIDDPLLNIALKKKRNIKSKILLIFLKRSKYADTTVLINKDEIARFSKYFNIPETKIIDIPPVYYSDVENNKTFENKLLEQFGSDKIILFYGDMTYEQNRDALNYIRNNVAPKLKEIENKCKFVFAGKGTEKLENNDVCIYMGFLTESELFTLIRHSYLVLAPIFEKHESGIKTKVMNAISLGTPVLSTPSGVYGLEKEGLPAFISSINDFPDKLFELVSNDDEVKKMREKIGNYIKRFYSEKAMEKWAQIINT